jgi:hypothetical protein
MNCDQVIDRAVAWVDGELSPAEMELVEDHLLMCEACSTAIEQLAALEIQPPQLQLRMAPNYWEKMDDVLAEELEARKSSNSHSFFQSQMFWVLAAGLLLSFSWGVYEYKRAEDLATLVQHQQQSMERMQRISIQPKSPPRTQSYVVPVNYVPRRMDL